MKTNHEAMAASPQVQPGNSLDPLLQEAPNTAARAGMSAAVCAVLGGIIAGPWGAAVGGAVGGAAGGYAGQAKDRDG